METEDLDYADIAILKEVLADPGRHGDDCEDSEQFENIIVSDEEGNNLAENDEIDGRLTHSYLDLDEIELNKDAPSPRMCRALGSAYYDLLYITEKQLQALLDKSRAKIKDVQDRIDAARNQATVSRNNWYYMFGIPYFKDRRYFPCPSNEDHLRKLASKELSIIDLPPLRQWKTSYKIKLEEAIKSEEIANHMKNKDLSKDTAEIRKQTLAELVGFRKSEYDWMKISVQIMENYYSPEECRAMWFNYLHPMINRTKWDAEEDEKLIKLVNLHKNQNWDLIATELSTHRSGYQCMCQYQTRLNDKLRKSKWTEEEDNYLREVVDFCRVGSYIPWAKVTSYMDGRSKNQVFNRWAYSLDPNIKRGRFTQEEDVLVVAAVRRYGTDNFKRVARFLPGRTSVQVRDRYNSYLKFQTSSERWSPHEDATLMALVKQYGEGSWSKISQHFNNRSRTQVRHRFTTIQSWMKKMNVFDGEIAVPTRKINVDDNREEKVWSRVQSILRSMKASLEINEHNLLKLKERLNLDQKKRPGRKIGQKKVISKIEKEYYSFFRCIYTQFGGRRKLYFDQEVTRNFTEAIKVMLEHFQAQLEVPKSNYVIDEDHILDESDKVILRNLRDEKQSSKSMSGTRTENVGTKVESISNERLNFQTNSSTNVAESLGSSNIIVNSNIETKSSVSYGKYLSATEGKYEIEDAVIGSSISNVEPNSAINATDSSSGFVSVPGNAVTKPLRTYGRQSCNNKLTNSFRTYGKQSSSGNINNTFNSIRTYVKQSSETQITDVDKTECKDGILNSSVLNATLNFSEKITVNTTVSPNSSASPEMSDFLEKSTANATVFLNSFAIPETLNFPEESTTNITVSPISSAVPETLSFSEESIDNATIFSSSSATPEMSNFLEKSTAIATVFPYSSVLNLEEESTAITASPSSSATHETFLRNSMTSNSSEASNLDVNTNPLKIPYLCPPNHTTLVGFRTLLLSRRNITKLAEFTQNNTLDRTYFKEDSDSESITPSTAALLWKERLFSLFVWPAVMSNVVPLMMDHVFRTEDGVDQNTDCKMGGASTSNNVAEKSQKSKRNTGKKRKYNFLKKKEVKIKPPEKKRKYDRSGKFRKQGIVCKEPRRSVRKRTNTTDGDSESSFSVAVH